GAVRAAEGQRAGTRFDEKRIGVSMIATAELDDLVASGEAAREPDGGHAGLGARVAHANLLHARHGGADQFCHRHLEWIRNSETRAIFGCPLDRFDDSRMRMAED